MVEKILHKPVLALSISSSLGGSERSLLEFARRSCASEIDLRVAMPEPGPLSEALKGAGIPVEFVDALGPLLHLSQQPGRSPLRNGLAASVDFVRAGRAIKAISSGDTVYSNSFKTHLATAAARIKNSVWHIREFPPATTSFAWAPITAHTPVGLIANSHAVAQAWRDLIAPLSGRPPGVSTIHNGVDTKEFSPIERSFWLHDTLGIPRDAFVFGMPAAFASWKGHLEVIAAFERVAAIIPMAHLVLVGGPIYDTTAERQFTRSLAERLDADTTGRLHHLGFEKDIARVYPEFDCTLHYSLRPEPFGRVVIESMACGTPIIAAAEGGPLEILDGDGPGEATGGWLCKPGNVTALAHAMERVARLDATKLKRVGETGRKRAVGKFDADTYAKKVVRVLLGEP